MTEQPTWVPGSTGGLIPKPAFLSGRSYGPLFVPPLSAQNMGGSNLFLAPFIVPVLRTFDRIGLSVVGAGTAGTVIRLAIYKDDGLAGPDQLVLDAGVVAGDAVASPSIVINQTLTPGLYWTGAAAQNVGGTLASVRAGLLIPGLAFPTFIAGSLQSLVAAWLRLGAAPGAMPASLAPTAADYDGSSGLLAPLVSLRAA